jgi:hypothetical protein
LRRIAGAMIRLGLALIVLVLSGFAHAAAPDFNTEHFCSGFAQQNAGNMPEMAKAVCMMSEESTKAVVVAAWDHAPAAARDACERLLCQPGEVPEDAPGTVRSAPLPPP